MHPPREAALDWEEYGRAGETVVDVLCLIAFASCMKNGITLKAIFWDMKSVIAKPKVTRVNTKVVFL